VVVDAIAYTEQQAKSLVAALRGIAGRIVVLSSGDVYRANDILFRRVEGAIESTPLLETSPLRDRLYPYRGMSIPHPPGLDLDDYEKILVERAVLGDANLPATVLRLPMVYGPGAEQAARRRFFAYLKRMDDDRPSILLDKRTAQWLAPWGFVGDMAEAVRLAVENERAAGEVYNAGELESLDIRGWIRELASVAGWAGQIVTVDEPCPPPNLPRQLNPEQHLHMNTTKIRRELGCHEIFSRREALERTVVWDREHPPKEIDPAQFDYAAEDAILNRATAL